MAPNIMLHDMVLANHSAYLLDQPQRGDVVVYFDSAKNTVAIKRIVGIPGDVLTLSENRLSINGIQQPLTLMAPDDFADIHEENGLGKIIAEENIFGRKHFITFSPQLSPKRNFGAGRLAAGEYFILGDHRDNSADSRYIGPIQHEQILAKVIWVYHKS